LQGRWNIDSDDMRGWNDAVFKTSGEVSENKGAYFELEYTEGTDPASFKVGRIELEVRAFLERASYLLASNATSEQRQLRPLFTPA